MTTRPIYLHGSLEKQFKTSCVNMAADTISEVIQALIFRFGPAFKQAIRSSNWQIFRGPQSANKDVSEQEIGFALKEGEEVHLVPTIVAASSTVRIIIGAALLTVAYFFPVTAPYLVPMGTALIVGGVAEMLAPKPNIGGVSQSGSNPSFLFNGPVNVTEQGVPVPIIFGRVRRCSTVILSAGLTVENLAT